MVKVDFQRQDSFLPVEGDYAHHEDQGRHRYSPKLQSILSIIMHIWTALILEMIGVLFINPTN